MELVYIAAAIMIGLGALGTGIGFALLGGKAAGRHRSSTGTGSATANQKPS